MNSIANSTPETTSTAGSAKICRPSRPAASSSQFIRIASPVTKTVRYKLSPAIAVNPNAVPNNCRVSIKFLHLYQCHITPLLPPWQTMPLSRMTMQSGIHLVQPSPSTEPPTLDDPNRREGTALPLPPQLRRRVSQRHAIVYGQHLDVPVDAFQEAAQHCPRAELDEPGKSLGNQPLH